MRHPTCIDCRKRAGSPRGFAGVRVCDPCWLLRTKYGPPRDLGTFDTVDDGAAVVGHVVHEEHSTISIYDKPPPARCPAFDCCDGLQSNGLDRCETCGGTGERDRVWKKEK